MRRLVLLASLIALAGLVIGSCGEGPDLEGPSGPAYTVEEPGASDLGGDALPVQQPGDDYDHTREPVTGTLTMRDDGCWTADLGDSPRLVVFPAAYTKSDDERAVMLAPDGMVVTDGMAFDGVGGLVPPSALPGGSDGYWGNYIAFCEPAAVDLLVLDSIGPAYRPDEATVDELVALLGQADLDVSWGCGLGFTVSTEDQRVALFVAPLDSGSSPDPPISFPDGRWQAEVQVGKNLMVNHCNDAIEGWKPQPQVSARWQLASGVLDFVPSDSDGGCDPNPVTAKLRDVTVDTPIGEVALQDLRLLNDAYGCFAG